MEIMPLKKQQCNRIYGVNGVLGNKVSVLYCIVRKAKLASFLPLSEYHFFTRTIVHAYAWLRVSA